MNRPPSVQSHRILVIDDNHAIHADIRKILCPAGLQTSALTDVKALLFGDAPAACPQDEFEIDSAFQGEEGLLKVQTAAREGRPYAMAFVDVRMPPGWDGVETITRIWKDHPDLQVVICTAYSDYSWEEMVRQIGRSSSMVVLKKPFDNIEVLQLAHALTEKWRLNLQVRRQLHDLDQLVDERTVELRAANDRLKREIAERLLVERALVLSEERFSKAFQANPIPLAIQSLQRETIIDANHGFLALTGYRREELLEHTPQQLGLWADPERSRQILDTLRHHTSLRHSQGRLRTQSGDLRDILLSIELIELAGETCLLTIVQDITEQLSLEKQLRHSQKMEAVGQLAAGIAHDFNNMLTVIQGNASLVLLDETEDPGRSLLEGIVAAAQRSARMVRQLLTFSHKQALEPSALDIGDLLRSLAELLPRMLGEQTTLQLELPDELPLITVDSGLIEQLLMNLAVNARDAMADGGTLSLSAHTTRLTASDCRLHGESRPGSFLRLSVSDTGCGIPPEMLPRIFEPFFTTKPVGKGTGLGLATVYGIVRQHDGWIEVESELGHGTTFHIFLPLADGTPTTHVAATRDSALHALRSETVLVVEDEEPVRCCVTTILESHGYRVLSAANGSDALAVWKDHAHEVDLLMTDLVMPSAVSGLELAQRLRRENPDLKIIYTSGYDRDLTTEHSSAPNGHRFLAKPYQSTHLLQVIRDCLDQVETVGTTA